MAGKIPLKFKIYKGDQFLREESLAQPVIKVGKLSSSHLRLDDDSVSRMHAVIEVSSPNEISIIDLGSTKGTIVNGQKVNKAKLQEGDEIVLGDIRIELSLSGAADAFAEEDEPTRVGILAADAALPATPTPAAPKLPSKPAAPVAPPAAPPAAPVAPPVAASAPAPTPAAAPPRPAAPPAAAAAAPSGPSPFAQSSASSPLTTDPIDDITGARAVEVAGMLGDSVVGVKHVMNPRSGKVTSTTWAMFGVGGLLVILAFVGFFIGVSNASYNKQSREHHTEELKKPLHEWRPRRISVAYDWMAIVGSLGGLFCLTYGVSRYRNERVSPYFRIGRASDVDFPLDDAPAESFPLVAPLGDDFVFNYSANMTGELTVDGQSISLAELQGQGRARPSTTAPGGMEATIPQGGRFRVSSGNTTFIVSSVAQPRKQPVPLFASMESAVVMFFAGSLIVHIALLALLWNVRRVNENLVVGGSLDSDSLSRVNTTAQEDPKNEEEEDPDNGEEEAGGTGTKMALEEGKMGKKDSNRATGQFAMKKNGEEQQLAKAAAVEAARTSGILGVMSAQQGGTFASLTGTGDFSSGLDERDVMGGLLGNEVGEMQGGWGYGVSGTGPGGGGTGWGTVGLGNYGKIGHGKGTGTGYGTGSGKGGLRGRKARPPQVKIGNASATGDLDKNIIRRYIRRKLPRIRNCYERQLLVKSNLSGTIVTNFQISPQGRVLNSTASGLRDKTVESCVAAAIKSIQFPKPKGGGLVNVRYPFTFRPAGG